MGGSEKTVIDGPAGALEALWLPAGTAQLSRAVALCHPHPLYGGTMETKLVARTARRLSDAGFQTLRFNFRGVGRSEGSWSGGTGERDDLRAALDFILARLPEARLGVFGFSFGAMVALDVGSERSDVEVLVAVAPPVAVFTSYPPPDSPKPTFVIGAGADEIVDPERLREWYEKRKGVKQFRMFPDADHLFADDSYAVADEVARFVLKHIS